MPTRAVRKSRHLRVAYAGAGICFSLAALVGAVAAAGAATSSTVTSVSVRDFAFSPAAVTVVKGGQVRFTNTGEALHRVVSDDGTIDTHPLQPGHNATVTFDTLGAFPLHDEIYPTMQMTVTVVASQAHVPAAAPAPASSPNPTAPPSAEPTGTTKTAAAPTALAQTGGGATAALSLLGLGLILVGMLCLAMGRARTSPIPAIPSVPSAVTIARVMGWENRFDDLLPGRITDALRRSPPQ